MKANVLIDALKMLNQYTAEVRDHFVQTGEGLNKYREVLFVTTEFETHVKACLHEIQVSELFLIGNLTRQQMFNRLIAARSELEQEIKHEINNAAARIAARSKLEQEIKQEIKQEINNAAARLAIHQNRLKLLDETFDLINALDASERSLFA